MRVVLMQMIELYAYSNTITQYSYHKAIDSRGWSILLDQIEYKISINEF